MDLQWLQANGGLVAQAPVVRTVSWTHLGPEGQEVTDTFSVRVRKLSVGDVERLVSESSRKPGRSYTASIIAESILLGEQGNDRFTYEQAFQLDPSLAEVLLEDAVNPVNPLRRRKGGDAKND